MKKFWVPLSALVLAAMLAAGGLLLLDFQATRGQFNSEQTVTTASFGREGGGTSLSRNQELDVYIQAPRLFQGQLSRALAAELEKNPFIRRVDFLEGDLEKAQDAVLIVQVDQAEALWLPFFGRAQLHVTLHYASDGEVDWIDDVVIRSKPGKYTRRVSGDFTMRARAAGLMSLPGFHHYLADETGAQLNKSLLSALEG